MSWSMSESSDVSAVGMPSAILTVFRSVSAVIASPYRMRGPAAGPLRNQHRRTGALGGRAPSLPPPGGGGLALGVDPPWAGPAKAGAGAGAAVGAERGGG